MEDRIIAFSGRKQSGKNSLADFLVKNAKEILPGYTVRTIGFADTLKDIICDIFDIPINALYGNDEDKNVLTDVKWNGETLSVRRLLQVFGTDIVRSMKDDAWVCATIKRIRRRIPTDGTSNTFSIITDLRFQNEVDAIHQIGGKVVRLTRNEVCLDAHKSETALDRDKYNWANFDAIIDNDKMTLGEQNRSIVDILRSWGWIYHTF